MIMQGENLYQCNALFNDAESTTINDLKHSNDLDLCGGSWEVFVYRDNYSRD